MRSPSIVEPTWVKNLLIGAATGFITLMVVLPLLVVFFEALSKGLLGYTQAFDDPYTITSIKLTLLVALVVVPLNAFFGITAAWCISRFSFPGKRLLVTLIDLPFSVSPVIAGMLFVLLLGANSMIGGFLIEHGFPIIFAVPGLVVATLFITIPFVARELIPLMNEQGSEEEEAALLLGANGWQMFWRITLPNIRWGLVYGVLLCNARAMGEFGAVSVVSGHIQGVTNTIPLQVEMLYNEYNFISAFAVASLLTMLALITLVVKTYIEHRYSIHSKPS